MTCHKDAVNSKRKSVKTDDSHSVFSFRVHTHPDSPTIETRVGMILSGPIISYHVFISIVVIGLIVEKILAVKIFSTINTIAASDHRIRSYGIVTRRNNPYLIVFPNLCDRDQCWRRQTSRSVQICCDLQRSVTICYDLSRFVGSDCSRRDTNGTRTDKS